MTIRAVLVAITTITMIGITSYAQRAAEERPAATRGVEVTTLLYDIRGLLQPARDYPSPVLEAVNQQMGRRVTGGSLFGGGGGGGNPAEKPDEKPSTSQKVDSLIKLIEDTVDSESWKDNGGPVGAIREFNGMLVVTQTPESHAKLKELLSKLPDQESRLVRVRVEWIFADPEQLRFENGRAPGALREIDRASIEKLPKDVVRARAETTCFTGQTVSLVSGRQQSYVSDVSPIVGQQAVGLDPTIAVFQTGAELQVTPTIQTDGKSAVIDVHSIVSDWDEATPYELRAGAGVPTTQASGLTTTLESPNQIQRPRPVIQQLHTTLRVPLGKSIIVGGMTFEPSPREGQDRQLLLVIEVSSG